MELGYLASLHTDKEPQYQHVVDEIRQKDAGEREFEMRSNWHVYFDLIHPLYVCARKLRNFVTATICVKLFFRVEYMGKMENLYPKIEKHTIS